jgi:hypothetical protein
MMKKIFSFFLLFAAVTVFAQQSINNYKYVVVPEIYDFQTKKDEYSLNTFTKMLFEKYGFQAYFPNVQFPAELALDRCRGLYADVVKEGGFVNTDLTIVLKDCNGNEVYRSAAGRSKEKDKKLAYQQAFREAAASLEGMDYKYDGSSITVTKPVTKTETVTVYVPSSAAAGAKVVNNVNELNAKPTGYGYELLDKAGKVVIKMYKTTQADYYSAKMETLTGVVFKKEDQWVFEYYDRDDKLVSEKLNIKF